MQLKEGRFCVWKMQYILPTLRQYIQLSLTPIRTDLFTIPTEFLGYISTYCQHLPTFCMCVWKNVIHTDITSLHTTSPYVDSYRPFPSTYRVYLIHIDILSSPTDILHVCVEKCNTYRHNVNTYNFP